MNQCYPNKFNKKIKDKNTEINNTRVEDLRFYMGNSVSSDENYKI